ncbi:2Fe-2S iron-sulfur cluster-binding protein [Mycolicibacterium sp.]|uniref:2Fe-2S iron-sulfur cluster-binding protein n=1 Tax=Mycolicibacterium sp. TaxID=2320850 RepID=UPI0037CAD926
MSSSLEHPSEAPRAAFQVQVAGTDLRFGVAPGERILAAGRRAGVWLPFECGWGSCGTCKVTLVDGEVDSLYPDAPAIDARDERRRRILACQCTPKSDITVKVLKTGQLPERPTVDHTAEVVDIEDLGNEIRRFRFRLGADAQFRPGQYAIFDLGTGLRRCYSMATLPGTDVVEFIAKRYSARPGSGALFSLAPGDRVAVELPYGDMWFRANDRDVVLTAGGTGLSPIMALLRHFCDLGLNNRVWVFYGANSEAELVCWPEMQALIGRLSAAELHGAVARPGDQWTGTRGLVTDALKTRLPDLPDAEHYLAGPPVMVDAVLDLLSANDVPKDRIHYDRFG